jgi:uncharacterized protein (DUF58 family)
MWWRMAMGGRAMVAPLARDDLLDTDFLDRLRVLALRLRKRRHLLRKGPQSSLATGFTREFKDFRRYSAGEDYRAIDWRLYARLGKLFVRLYEESQELHLHLFVDVSGSMVEPHAEKRVQALRFAVALAYLALSQHQRVSLYSMRDGLTVELPPLSGKGAVEKVITAVLNLSYGGRTSLVHCFEGFRPSRQRLGLNFVISDFYGQDLEALSVALARVAAWPGETHLVQIMHPLERAPALEGEVELAEVETGERRRFWLTPSDVRRYSAAYDAWVAEMERECAGRQVNFLQVGADEPFDDRFLDLLMRGVALSGG